MRFNLAFLICALFPSFSFASGNVAFLSYRVPPLHGLATCADGFTAEFFNGEGAEKACAGHPDNGTKRLVRCHAYATTNLFGGQPKTWEEFIATFLADRNAPAPVYNQYGVVEQYSFEWNGWGRKWIRKLSGHYGLRKSRGSANGFEYLMYDSVTGMPDIIIHLNKNEMYPRPGKQDYFSNFAVTFSSRYGKQTRAGFCSTL